MGWKLTQGKLAAVCAMGAAFMLSGCGKNFFQAVNNNPGGTGSTSYVYVTNVSSTGSGGTISAYSISSGVLSSLSGSPYTLTATPTSIAVAPNDKFLYLGTSLGVFLYTINSDGTLTEGNNNTIVYLGPTQTQAVAVDSTSSWLIVANQNSKELDALAVSPTTGIPPSSTPVSVQLDAATPARIRFAPANNNVFVSLGAGGTDAISFSPTGSKTFGTPVQIALLNGSSSAKDVAVDTTSAYLFIAEATTNKLRVISLSNLSKDVADYSTGNNPTAILPDASGGYVYVANSSDNTISGFSNNAGTLTALADSPFATAKAPVGLVEDPSKSFILSAGFGTNPNLWIYSFDTVTAGTLDVKSTTSTASVDPSLANAIAMTH